MSSKYTIDFIKLIGELLPPRKRTPIRIKWLYRLLKWFRNIQAEFITLEALLANQQLISSQVIIFESYLVDLFGVGITITVNEITQNKAVIYSSADSRTGLTVISTNQEIGGSSVKSAEETAELYNFIVNVPAALSADLEQMAALINRYKTPGSTYQIKES